MTESPDPYSVEAPHSPPPVNPDVPLPGSPPPPGPIGYATPGASVAGYTGPAPTKDDQSMGMLAHLLGILGFVGPLIIWLIKKDQSPFVDDQGKEALNFHLTMLIGYVIGFATMFACVRFVIVPAVWIVSTVFSILGAMKAKDGIAYRYPFAIRLIK